MTRAAVSLLDSEMYDIPLAASILRVPESTLRWWLEGRTTEHRTYAPVLRPEPTGSSAVTWGELVEAGYLAGYRRTLGVRLARLRDFIALLRDELAVPYPLATAKPWVGPGRRLLMEAGDRVNLDPELRPGLIEPTSGQGVLTGIGERFLARVEFEPPDSPDGEVARIRPWGRQGIVVIDPLVRFGVPSVRGISTGVLAEKCAAGETIEALADDYGLRIDDVVAAIDYERTDWPLQLVAA